MLPFKLVYSEDYLLPIGAHVFPAEKYRRIHDQLLETRVAEPSDFVTPQPASDQDILLVHTPQYVHKLKTGTLSPREEQEMEIPYSPELVRAFWLAAGGSILAASTPSTISVAFNIGGGFHHAFPDHGEGFCMIHDVAVAIRRMQRDDTDSHCHDGGLRRSPRQRHRRHLCRHTHPQRAAAFHFGCHSRHGLAGKDAPRARGRSLHHLSAPAQ